MVPLKKIDNYLKCSERSLSATLWYLVNLEIDFGCIYMKVLTLKTILT